MRHFRFFYSLRKISAEWVLSRMSFSVSFCIINLSNDVYLTTLFVCRKNKRCFIDKKLYTKSTMSITKGDEKCECYPIRKIVNIISILGIVATIIATIYFIRLGVFKDINALRGLVGQSVILGPIIFMLIQIIQVVIPIIPGGVSCAAGS